MIFVVKKRVAAEIRSQIANHRNMGALIVVVVMVVVVVVGGDSVMGKVLVPHAPPPPPPPPSLRPLQNMMVLY